MTTTGMTFLFGVQTACENFGPIVSPVMTYK